MSLEKYREKRHFDQTPEPSGAPAVRPADAPAAFVIQKHAASRLHYDVRLELDGVFKSWAVPKGPSMDTRDRRLAVHVEDHPLEYGSFEGTIPAGEYGGGTVMVWDRGTYTPKTDMAAGYESGSMKFILHGEKLQGGFTLVRMKPREGEKGDNWLLIKERDEHVRSRDEYDVTEARPESAASGRDMGQIAEGGDPRPRAPAEMPPSAASRRLDEPAVDIPMQLARLADTPPEGAGWIREVKYDGYRVRASVEDGVARMLTRSGQDWTDRFEPIARSVAALPVSSAILDGEVVVFGENGVPDFAALQHALGTGGDSDTLAYVAFDLLALDGWDLRDEPLLQRKELLRSLLEAAAEPSPLRFAEHVETSGAAFHEAACELSLEGSVSKRSDRPYRAGRSPEWQKVKCLLRQEFVVGGFTEPGGSRRGFGALLLGVYRDEEFAYVGRVGTGFTEADLESLGSRLRELETPDPGFADPPEIPGKKLRWVRPELVAEVRFQEWTPEGVLRHPSFLGLRDDKPATEVVRENAAPRDSGSTDAPPAEPVTVAGERVTNPDKEIFAAQGAAGHAVTKLDLAHYYELVATRALVHLKDRPLTLVRCPHGSEADCFYQKHPDARGSSSAIHTVEILEHSGERASYMFVDDPAGLVALAQLGVLEIHAWNSLVGSVEQPDRIVFDLDPGPDVAWPQIAQAARLLREALGALGLPAFLKATGGKGLHVVVPIIAEHDYATVREFARTFASLIVEHDPTGFTIRLSKSLRPGRVFIDYLRNAHGATAIAPFSTRARPGAPVSFPLAWDELDEARAPILGLREFIDRLKRRTADPWSGYEDERRPLDAAIFSAVGMPFTERLGSEQG